MYDFTYFNLLSRLPILIIGFIDAEIIKFIILLFSSFSHKLRFFLHLISSLTKCSTSFLMTCPYLVHCCISFICYVDLDIIIFESTILEIHELLILNIENGDHLVQHCLYLTYFFYQLSTLFVYNKVKNIFL